MQTQTPMFILAGGLGTRLKEVLDAKPKALAPIGKVPFLELVIEHWIDKGIRDFVLLLGYKSELIIEFIELNNNPSLKKANFRFVVEEAQLGTGGAIANAIKELKINTNFLVINSDTWLSTNASGILKKDAPCIGLVWNDDVSRFGCVEVDKTMKIKGFSEKKIKANGGLINSGFCKLNPKVFKNWDGTPCSLEEEIFPQLILEGKLSGIVLDSQFIDIGIPADYAKFQTQLSDYKNE